MMNGSKFSKNEEKFYAAFFTFAFIAGAGIMGAKIGGDMWGIIFAFAAFGAAMACILTGKDNDRNKVD